MDVSLLLVWLLHIQHGGPFLQSVLSRAGAWSRGLSLFVQVNGEPAVPLLLSAHQNVLFCLVVFLPGIYHDWKYVYGLSKWKFEIIQMDQNHTTCQWQFLFRGDPA